MLKLFSLQFAKNYQKCIKQKIFTLEKEITDIEDSPSDTIDMVKKKELKKNCQNYVMINLGVRKFDLERNGLNKEKRIQIIF